MNFRITDFPSYANGRAYRGRSNECRKEVDVAGDYNAGSPGSDGASPYPELRRGPDGELGGTRADQSSFELDRRMVDSEAGTQFEGHCSQ
jgi:hypothetical protein